VNIFIITENLARQKIAEKLFSPVGVGTSFFNGSESLTLWVQKQSVSDEQLL